jgi:phage terminase large subunit-like protein
MRGAKPDLPVTGTSAAEDFADLPAEERAAQLRKESDAYWTARERDWAWWQRPDQQIPPGDWTIWLVMAGRGFGKTRMGAEWVRSLAEAQAGLRIALVGATMADVRSVMVEGECGLLSIAPDAWTPHFEPSLRRLTWPNGTMAQLYSAAEPDSLRGGQHDFVWADEVAKWENGIPAWNNMMFGMRLGTHPRVMATTTPRPVPLIRRLMKQKGIVRSGGATQANKSNLPPSYLTAMQATYGGTKLGRQELDGDFIDDNEDALFSRDLIEQCRVTQAPPIGRIVIGVDPPASSGGDACGIIVVGRGVDDRAYVLADCSVKGRSPEGWARAVAAAAQLWNADRVIAEGNQGGEMVEATLRGANVAMPIKRVHASVGKVARAEPVLTLFESRRALLVGAFPELEDELCGLLCSGIYQGPGRSPDRADACVWAMTELMLGRVGVVPRVRVF